MANSSLNPKPGPVSTGTKQAYLSLTSLGLMGVAYIYAESRPGSLKHKIQISAAAFSKEFNAILKHFVYFKPSMAVPCLCLLIFLFSLRIFFLQTAFFLLKPITSGLPRDKKIE